MCRAKRVINAFGADWKPADAVTLTQGLHAVAPTSENFVRIGLMAHIPNNAVIRGIEHVMQSHREFNRTQIGAQMTPGL